MFSTLPLKGLAKAALAAIIFGLTTLPPAHAAGPERPLECWVFRSVFEGRPRMLTVALHRDLYLAYDAQTCALYKAWAGNVRLEGAVYNAQHGPQPSADGPTLALDPADASAWQLSRAGKPLKHELQFKGYTWRNNQVVLKYQLISAGLSAPVTITENPEWAARPNGTGLVRTFSTQGLPADVQLRLRVSTARQSSADATSSNTPLELLQRTENLQGTPRTWGAQGWLTLAAHGPTVLQTTFAPAAQ